MITVDSNLGNLNVPVALSITKIHVEQERSNPRWGREADAAMCRADDQTPLQM